MTDTLLQEVDAALRADRAAALWAKHKRSMIAIAAALVLGAAANSAWQHYRENRGGKTMAALVASQKLLDTGNAEGAAQAFGEVAAANSGTLKTLALIWQSRALVQAGKSGDAAQALVHAADGDSLWSDVACLRLAGLDAAAAKPCLTHKATSPLSRERAQWAAASAWEAGDAAAARASLEALIADENTSQETRARLMQWRAVMNLEEHTKP